MCDSCSESCSLARSFRDLPYVRNEKIVACIPADDCYPRNVLSIHRVVPRALESTRINSLGKWSPRRTRRAGRRNTVKRVDATIRRYLFLLLPPINSRSCVDDPRALLSICHCPALKSCTTVSVSSSPFYPARSLAYIFKIPRHHAIRTYFKDRFTSVRLTTDFCFNFYRGILLIVCARFCFFSKCVYIYHSHAVNCFFILLFIIVEQRTLFLANIGNVLA